MKTFSIFQPYADQLVQELDQRTGWKWMETGPEDQARLAVEAVSRVHRAKPLFPASGTSIDLAGFGTTERIFSSAEGGYVSGLATADALGWLPYKFHAWATKQREWALMEQRKDDEERADGRLGWHHMTDYISLDMWAIMDDPEAKPDAGGGRYSEVGEWLIAERRLPWLLSCSPWGREFYENTKDHFGMVFKAAVGEKLKAVQTFGADGQPTGGNAYDDMFVTDLTEEQALRKARRGPVADPDDDRPA